MMSVPRLYEKMFVQVQQVVQSRPPSVQKLFNGALAVGKEVFDLESAGKPVPMSLRVWHRFARRIAKKVLAEGKSIQEVALSMNLTDKLTGNVIDQARLDEILSVDSMTQPSSPKA